MKNIRLWLFLLLLSGAAVLFPISHAQSFSSHFIDVVPGGGVGGNLKIGQLNYDGQPGHQSSFMVERDPLLRLCYLRNGDVIVKDNRTSALVSYACTDMDSEHNDVFWNTLDDSVNGGYSPNNDTIAAITFLKNMYRSWYLLEPLKNEDGKAVTVTVYTHVTMDNATWEGKKGNEWVMRLGDGGNVKYPSTAIGVVAHELAHGVTEQNSNLIYAGQSGGLNESFSDMADQAAQYYAFDGKNNWMHDAEIMKADGKALRYLDKPSRDCGETGVPGKTCSIDHISQYLDTTNVHYSSGIFNRIFYLIGTAPGWDAKKTFDIMLQANRFYWTANTSFDEAACGVLQAARDYQYDTSAVNHAFKVVGINASRC